MGGKLPTGVQDFERLRGSGFLYVDKTAYVWQIAHATVPNFLSRPRRFGKSLLVSTLKYFLEGRRDLFEGLEADRLESGRDGAWTARPVFHLDLDGRNYTVFGALETKLDETLSTWEEIWGDRYANWSLEGRFEKLVEIAHRESGQRVAVLIDEYDKPLLDTMENAGLMEHNGGVLRGFYGVLKKGDAHICNTFVTGITRFTKVYIFSELNNMRDLTISRDYAGVCGITEQEISSSLMDKVEALADELGTDKTTCLTLLARAYDGYCFHPKGPDAKGSMRVYNPYSLLCALSNLSIDGYWLETDTPDFLVKRIRKVGLDPRRLTDGSIYAEKSYLMDFRAEGADPIPLLFQTGYLTIRGADGGDLMLALPNEEVERGLFKSLLWTYVPSMGPSRGNDVSSLRRYVEAGNTDGMRDCIASLFAGIPYTSATGDSDPFENYFQAILYVTLTLLGHYVTVEMHTATGRVDVVIEARRFVYVIEIKRDGTTAEALAQLRKRIHTSPFAADSRGLFEIGCTFDSASRLMSGWEAHAVFRP